MKQTYNYQTIDFDQSVNRPRPTHSPSNSLVYPFKFLFRSHWIIYRREFLSTLVHSFNIIPEFTPSFNLSHVIYLLPFLCHPRVDIVSASNRILPRLKNPSTALQLVGPVSNNWPFIFFSILPNICPIQKLKKLSCSHDLQLQYHLVGVPVLNRPSFRPKSKKLPFLIFEYSFWFPVQ